MLSPLLSLLEKVGQCPQSLRRDVGCQPFAPPLPHPVKRGKNDDPRRLLPARYLGNACLGAGRGRWRGTREVVVVDHWRGLQVRSLFGRPQVWRYLNNAFGGTYEKVLFHNVEMLFHTKNLSATVAIYSDNGDYRQRCSLYPARAVEQSEYLALTRLL